MWLAYSLARNTSGIDTTGPLPYLRAAQHIAVNSAKI
jgi:hypothetical protein